MIFNRIGFFAYLKSATMGVGLGATPAAHLSERA